MSSGNTLRKLDNANFITKEWHGAAAVIQGWKFKARTRLRLTAARFQSSTAGTSGTIYIVKKAATSTADVSDATNATEMASIDATTTANTGADFTLTTTAANLVVEPGQWVGVYFSSVATLALACIQAEFDPIP